jgi:thiamine-phosphate pyrophosphorylase
VLRYYITDRGALGGVEPLLCSIEAAASRGVDYIQIREKDLCARDLLELTRRAVQAVRGFGTRILVNGRADVALAAGAHGVHLPGESIAPSELRRLLGPDRLIAVSCHTIPELQAAEREGADFAVFGPVFDAPGKGAPVGIEGLRTATESVALPVLALGGITHENAPLCIRNGAAGIAGIRLFQTTPIIGGR